MRTPSAVRWFAAGTLAAAGFAALPSLGATKAGCDLAWHGSGGDWPTRGGNGHQSNFQAAERRITPGNVASMQLAWTSGDIAGGGSTPSVAGSCVYFANEG